MWKLLILVGICLVLQVLAFVDTLKKRIQLRNIFPKQSDRTMSLVDREDDGKQILVRKNVHSSKVFDEIINTINRYLSHNKGSADYAILKDITDRNCDAVEAQIEATSSIPVYIGLCGTLIGIVLGVAVLGFRGGIDALFDTTPVALVESLSEANSELRTEGSKVKTNDGNVYEFSKDQWNLYKNPGEEGIKNLLQGVGIAMLTTLFGVLFTIIGAWSSKRSSRVNEEKKNGFLSWLQAELLPQMSNDLGQAIFQMQRNLTKFNSTFAANTSQLDSVLKGINTTYEDQTRLLKAVEKLKIDEIATANIRVLQELKECTDKIEELGLLVSNTTEYITKVDNLNGLLSSHLDRTRLIENMGQFFKEEVTQIEQRKQAIANSTADIDANMQRAFGQLRNHTDREYQQLGDALANKHAEFLRAIEAQQEALNKKLEETSQLVQELKNLTAVKESMEQLALAEQSQNTKIETLVNASTEQNEKIKVLVDCVNKIAATASSHNTRLDQLQAAVVKSSEKTVEVNVKSPVVKTKVPLWKAVVEVIICMAAVGLVGIQVYTLFFK
ncbi:MAG: hypothetical protein IKX38_01510 [Bacteroidales bacterium]|nr:hypothetical protein [Bacteroidales bacterium]